jgi:pyruvate formate lyase activating enzyme
MILPRRQFLMRSGCALSGALLARAGAARGQDASPEPSVRPAAADQGRSGEITPESPFVREALFYEKMEEAQIRCRTCPHECVLSPGETGLCRAKMNLAGAHYSLSYGNPCVAAVDPIEKKPLFHYLPGSTAFSLAVAGCNFRCLNCQNWEISQISPRESRNYDMAPEVVVENARRFDCRSIAYTYSEPTSFYEFGLASAERARAAGIRNVWVSNGYIAGPPLDRLSRSLDAAAINLKSFEDRIYRDLNGGRLEPVQDTLVRLKKNGVWLEVINLVIPTYTDDLEMIRRMCGWFLRTLGPSTPLHFTRFNPLYKLIHLPPTPVETLVAAREAALAEGLSFVYIGNVPGLAEDTICPGCGQTVIRRHGFRIGAFELVEGRCRFCREPIAGVWS